MKINLGIENIGIDISESSIEVKLLHHTPLHIANIAIRTCYQSQGKSDCTIEEEEVVLGEKDKNLIHRVANKNKHASTIEHINFNFYLKGFSRALLQELSRHRIASLSVKSSRYTLKELINEESLLLSYAFYNMVHSGEVDLEGTAEYKLASKYLVMTGRTDVDINSMGALANLQAVLQTGTGNDYAKYCMPECFKTEATWSINLRNLQNFLELRTNKSALWEIRILAYKIYDSLPEEMLYLVNEHIYV